MGRKRDKNNKLKKSLTMSRITKRTRAHLSQTKSQKVLKNYRKISTRNLNITVTTKANKLI